MVANDNADAAKSLGWKIVYNDVYPVAGVVGLDAVRAEAEGQRHRRVSSGSASRRASAALIGRAARHRLPARLRARRRQPLRPEADRHRAATALADENVYVQSASIPFEQAKPTNATGEYLHAFERVQAGRQEPHLPRAAGVVVVAAVREGGRELRQRPDPDVHLRRGEEDPPRGPAAGCTPRPRRGRHARRVLRARAGDAEGLRPRHRHRSPTTASTTAARRTSIARTTDAADITTLADVGQNIKNMK